MSEGFDFYRGVAQPRDLFLNQGSNVPAQGPIERQDEDANRIFSRLSLSALFEHISKRPQAKYRRRGLATTGGPPNDFDTEAIVADELKLLRRRTYLW